MREYRIVQIGKEDPTYHVEEKVKFLFFKYWRPIYEKSDYEMFDCIRVRKFSCLNHARSFVRALLDKEHKTYIPII